jgi:hypothetical protein
MPPTKPILYDAYVEAAELDLLADDVTNAIEDGNEQEVEEAARDLSDAPPAKKRGRPKGSLKSAPTQPAKPAATMLTAWIKRKE